MSKLYQFVLLKLIIFLFFSNILFATNAELKLGVVGSFNNLNPYGIIGVNPKDYYLLVFDSLMIEQLDDFGNFKPLIAENYKIKDSDITFYINKKSPLKAEDVIYTFDVIKKYGVPYYKQKLSDVIVIEKKGDFEVIFKTKPFSQGLFNLIVSLPIISKEYWNGEDFLAPNLKVPLTSGAYFIESFKQGKKIIFKKNPNYWASDIPSREEYFNFDAISYKYVATNMQLTRLYKNGEINFKEYLPTDKIGKDDKIFIQKNKYIPTFKAYFFNTKGVLYDIELRKVINYAYNFDLVKEHFLGDNQIRLQSLFENTSFKDSTFIFSDNADLEKASQLLGDKKGIKIRFLFKSAEDFKISQDFINNLKKLGLDVSYKIPDFYDYIELRKKRDYDIIVEELLFSNPPSDELISYFTSGGEYNYSNVNEDISNLKALDLNLKKKYAYIPLYYNTTTKYIYKSSLKFKKQDTLDLLKWWHD